jgi:copper(I)-binding protein
MRTRTNGLRALAVLALVVPTAFLAACGDDDEATEATTTTAAESGTGSEAEAAEIEITDVWSRQVQDRGAVYMVIQGGSEDDALLSASVPAEVAGTVEIHETVAADGSTEGSMEEGSMESESMGEETTTTMAGGMGDGSTTTMAGGSGMMQMRPVDRIEIPAGGTVELEPGGYHVMLLDVPDTYPAVGETFEVTLTFEQAGEKTVTAEVREA